MMTGGSSAKADLDGVLPIGLQCVGYRLLSLKPCQASAPTMTNANLRPTAEISGLPDKSSLLRKIVAYDCSHALCIIDLFQRLGFHNNRHLCRNDDLLCHRCVQIYFGLWGAN